MVTVKDVESRLEPTARIVDRCTDVVLAVRIERIPKRSSFRQRSPHPPYMIGCWSHRDPFDSSHMRACASQKITSPALQSVRGGTRWQTSGRHPAAGPNGRFTIRCHYTQVFPGRSKALRRTD